MNSSLSKRVGIVFAVLFVAVAILFVSWRVLRSGDSDHAEAVTDAQGMEYVRANLTNPGSATFKNVKGPCGWVGYRDLYGIQTSPQRYVALGPDSVLIDRNMKASRFEFVWGQFCKGVIAQ